MTWVNNQSPANNNCPPSQTHDTLICLRIRSRDLYAYPRPLWAGGVLAFDTLDELGVLLDRLSPSLYLEMQGAALQNYRLITEEYKRMSPAHTMWATGVAEFATSLPRVVIFSPVRNQHLALRSNRYTCFVISGGLT